MKSLFIASLIVVSTAVSAEVVGSVKTATKLLGPNDAVVVESINDPEVAGVTCHVSYAKTGGIAGSIGFAEDPSRFSIACRQTGPIVLTKTAQDQKTIKAFDRNLFFKSMNVTRMFDAPNKTIIYLVTSRKLIDGSPYNAISSIPVAPWGAVPPVIQ